MRGPNVWGMQEQLNAGCSNKEGLWVWSTMICATVFNCSAVDVLLIYLLASSCLVEEKVLRVPWEALSFMAAEPFIKSLKFCTILLDKIRLYTIRQKKACIRC